jgi:hypothetical protein
MLNNDSAKVLTTGDGIFSVILMCPANYVKLETELFRRGMLLENSNNYFFSISTGLKERDEEIIRNVDTQKSYITSFFEALEKSTGNNL